MFQQSTSLQLIPLAKATLYTNHSRKWLLWLEVIRIKIFLLYLIIGNILYYHQFRIHSLVWGSCKLWWRVSWLYSVQQPYEPGKVTLTSLCFIFFRCIKWWAPTSPVSFMFCDNTWNMLIPLPNICDTSMFYLYVCGSHVYCAHGGQKRMLDPLGLELDSCKPSHRCWKWT